MAVFTSKSRDASGRLVEKVVDAPSRSEAMKLLEQSGLFPVKITEVLRSGVAEAAPRKETGVRTARRDTNQRVKRKELRTFSLQLSSALDAGVPLLSSLRMIGKQTKHKGFQAVLAQMVQDIEGGSSLSGAMNRFPRAFPTVYASTVAAGEQSGTVDRMLTNLAEYLEGEMEMLSDVRSALLYPAIVISALCMAVSVLVLFVIPRFAEFYSRFGAHLPLPTRIMIAGSHLVRDHGVLIALGLAVLFAGCVRFLRSTLGRGWLDRILLRIPVIGTVIETAVTLRVVQTLGLTTQAALPVLDTLELIASTTANSQIRGSIREVAAGVRSGETLSNSMEAAGCLQLSARQMLASGEATGSLERACFLVGKHYQRELHHLTKNLATFIEPLLTLVLAAIVLFVALAVFLPMWDLVKVVR